MSSKLYLLVLVAPFSSSTPAQIKDESNTCIHLHRPIKRPSGGDVSVGEKFALASFSKMVNNIGSSPDSESHSYKVGEATNSGTSGDGCIKEQDRLLPIANVGRIMKQILPPNAKVSKEAKETMQECVSEFISFVTGEASDKCRKEKRKTVNGDDICWALGTLGFDDYAETLKRYLHKYRELEGERANSGDHSRSSNTVINEESSSIFRSEQERKQQLGPSPLKFNLIDRNNTSFSRPF